MASYTPYSSSSGSNNNSSSSSKRKLLDIADPPQQQSQPQPTFLAPQMIVPMNAASAAPPTIPTYHQQQQQQHQQPAQPAVGNTVDPFRSTLSPAAGAASASTSSSSVEIGTWRSMFTVDTDTDLARGERAASFFRPPKLQRAFGFGKQQFRVDMDAPRDLAASAPSEFHFKIPRNSFDVLNDAHLVFTLPPIWSPVLPPQPATGHRWAPFEFRWIDDLGAQVVTEIRVTAGNQQLATYSGDYLSAVAKRDYDAARYAAFCDLTGNVPEVNDPANAYGRVNCYPTAAVTGATNLALGTQPSIEGRTVRVPVGAWFTHASHAALPVVCLGEDIDLTISVVLRPLQNWFRVRDVFDFENDFPLCRPDFNTLPFQLHRFLQSPPQEDASLPYANTTNFWNADVHLEVTGSFLTEFERTEIATKPQRYLVRDVKTYRQDNIAGAAMLKLESIGGMVASWTWHLSRSDVALRNEWANYTNWPYLGRPPAPLVPAPASANLPAIGNRGPRSNPPEAGAYAGNTGIFLSGNATDVNRRLIMATNAVVFNGGYRETDFPASTWNQGMRYTDSRNTRDPALYCYSFALNPNVESEQFSGGRDTSRVTRVQLQMSVFPPPLNTSQASQTVVCDDGGNVVSVNVLPSGQFQYTYNLVVYEERYNFVEFARGRAGLAVAT